MCAAVQVVTITPLGCGVVVVVVVVMAILVREVVDGGVGKGMRAAWEDGRGVTTAPTSSTELATKQLLLMLELSLVSTSSHPTTASARGEAACWTAAARRRVRGFTGYMVMLNLVMRRGRRGRRGRGTALLRWVGAAASAVVVAAVVGCVHLWGFFF